MLIRKKCHYEWQNVIRTENEFKQRKTVFDIKAYSSLMIGMRKNSARYVRKTPVRTDKCALFCLQGRKTGKSMVYLEQKMEIS